jgi:hypothetical protein
LGYPNEPDPPAPFAELPRRAHAPDLDPHELLLIAAARYGLPDAIQPRLEAVRLAWEFQVIQPFDDQRSGLDKDSGFTTRAVDDERPNP